MKKVKPLDDKILVKVIQEQPKETTVGGIILPQSAEKEKPMVGQVKAIGDSDMIKVKIGDNVLFTKFSGTEIKINQKDHIVLSASDVLAIVDL